MAAPRSATMGQRIAQARRLVGVREWRDMPASLIAERIKVADTTVTRWENGESQPSGELLARLAHALGVSSDYILTGANPPPGGEAATYKPAKARKKRGAAPDEEDDGPPSHHARG